MTKETHQGSAYRQLLRAPVSVFGVALGLGGLSNAWRSAAALWELPTLVADGLTVLTASLWTLCGGAWLGKWLWTRSAAQEELRDPARASLVALIPMSALVVSWLVRPRLPGLGWWVFVAGLIGQLGVAVWSTANMWRGDRPVLTINSSMLMPAVGGCFVGTLACSAFGQSQVAILFFGAGAGSWLITESVVLQRLMLHALPRSSRATLGIHLTPPAIASVAYLSITAGTPDPFSQMLFGYALLQAFVALRLFVWLREQPFTLGAWAYTFGLSALSSAAIRFTARGQTGMIASLAGPLFIFANAVIGWIALRTAFNALRRLFSALDTPTVETDPTR